MNIGRRIYYDKGSGNVILITSELSGDVINTTIEEDFDSYVVLSERIPSTIGMIQLDYGQYASEVAQYQLRIDTVTEDLIWTPRSNGTLEDVQAQKIKQLNDFCNAAILAGFTSDALGSDNTYDFDYDAQINLGGMLNAITAGIVTGDIVWKASGIPQTHTIDQFKAVFGAGLAHKNDLIAHYWTLKTAVYAATSTEEVEAITWETTSSA